MFSRILFCVNDPSHADYGWAAESRFLHMRKFDALGNTTAQWTFPVAETAPGEVRCAVCGGAVYVAAGAPPSPDQIVALRFPGPLPDRPGRRQSGPAGDAGRPAGRQSLSGRAGQTGPGGGGPVCRRGRQSGGPWPCFTPMGCRNSIRRG